LARRLKGDLLSHSYEVDIAEYFRLEAEDWLAAAKATGK
jgi:hypothetical protein